MSRCENPTPACAATRAAKLIFCEVELRLKLAMPAANPSPNTTIRLMSTLPLLVPKSVAARAVRGSRDCRFPGTGEPLVGSPNAGIRGGPSIRPIQVPPTVAIVQGRLTASRIQSRMEILVGEHAAIGNAVVGDRIGIALLHQLEQVVGLE